MKQSTEYKDIVAIHDEYTSPSYSKSRIPELKLYPYLIYVFIRANLKTRKNIYNSFEWVNTSRNIMRGIEKIGVKFQITGMDNFRNIDTPVIFIGNHMSTLETLVLPAIINPIKLVVFVTKKELTTMPLFGPINNARFPIVVGRSNARDDLMLVMNQGAERIKDGRSIILFPQKTRSIIFNPSEFNTLGSKLAKRNNVPIVPFALLTDAWPNGKLIKDLGKLDTSQKVHIAFGKPMEVTGNGSEQHQEVIEFVTTHLKKWGREEYIANN